MVWHQTFTYGGVNLLFQTIYYLIATFLILYILKTEPISKESIKELTLVSGNWFIKSYIILYLIAPALTLYVEHTKKNRIEIMLISLLIFSFLYGWIFPTSTEWMCSGYSPIWFICLYLIARYTAKYKPWYSRLKTSYYIISILLLVITLSISCLWWGRHTGSDNCPLYNFLTYNSPTTLLFAILAILLINKFNFRNALINRLAKSSFAVYLICCSPFILPLYSRLFQGIHSTIQGVAYWGIVISISLSVYTLTAIIDSIRIKIFDEIKNRFLTKCED